MKQKDIALVILIVAISGVISFFVSNSFITSPDKDQEAAVVAPIESEFVEPDDRYFNERAINPTRIIRIRNDDNTNPFE